MQGYPGGNAADQYLVQRVQGASPEQLVALLLEGGQKFINLALAAMKNKDVPGKARYVNRVSDIILELNLRLNREDGGELVTNLNRIYNWWTNELYDGARKNQPERLEMIRNQMGEMRNTWEEFHQKKYVSHEPVSNTASLNELIG
jgi:flagellar secretion chaperone FliS